MVGKEKIKINNKLRKYLARITGTDISMTIKKKMTFVRHHKQRVTFLKQLKEKGFFGKSYSDEVVKYDKNKVNRPLW